MVLWSAMSNNRKPQTPRQARDSGGSGRQKRSNESPEERMLREGGWRAHIINPGVHDIPLVVFLPPNGMGFYTKDQAIASESRKQQPNGEMLDKVGRGSKVPSDPETGIPWAFGTPPPPKAKSKRQLGRERSVCKMGKDPKTGEPVKLNREFRRRNKQRPE